MARLRQLDALRGVAAVSVMLHHFVSARIDGHAEQPHLPRAFWVAYRACHFLFLGREAVVFFFVLSGLVLGSAIARRRPLRYAGYALHRACRIYLPYLASLAITVAACAALHGRMVPWTAFMANAWTHAPTVREVAAHALFVGTYPPALNTAYWSLIVEMRVSLALPLLVAAIARMGARRALGAGVCLCLADGFAQPILRAHANPLAADWLLTLHYAPIFCFGIWIALHGEAVRRGMERMERMGPWPRRAALASAGLLAVYGWAALTPRIGDWFDCDALAALGASGVVCFALYDARVRAALEQPPLLWLGRISYSLYLIHVTVLLALVGLLGTRASYATILAWSVAGSLALAEAMQRCVERPAQALGRHWDQPPHAAAAVWPAPAAALAPSPLPTTPSASRWPRRMQGFSTRK